MHQHCQGLYRQRGKCPSCSAPWVEGQTGTLPIGEEAVGSSYKDVRVTRRGNTEEEEEEPEEEEQDEPDESQSQTQRTQSMDGTQARAKVGKVRVAASQRANGRRNKAV